MTGDDPECLRHVQDVVRIALPSLPGWQSVAREIYEGLRERGVLDPIRGQFGDLPQAVVDHLLRFRDDAVAAGSGTLAAQRLDCYLAHLRRAGWTLQSLATVLGVTRERVRQRVARAVQVDLGDAPTPRPPIPPPPQLPPGPLPQPAPPAVISDEDVQKLRKMHRLATQRRGRTPLNSPVVRAANELADLINHLMVEGGYSRKAVADALGVTPGAVVALLGRYGYRQLPPSQRGQRVRPAV